MNTERFMKFATRLVEQLLPEIEKSYHIDACNRIVTLSRTGDVCVYVENYTPKWHIGVMDWTAVDFTRQSESDSEVTVIASSKIDGLKMPKGDYSQCIWLIGDC